MLRRYIRIILLEDAFDHSKGGVWGYTMDVPGFTEQFPWILAVKRAVDEHALVVEYWNARDSEQFVRSCSAHFRVQFSACPRGCGFCPNFLSSDLRTVRSEYSLVLEGRQRRYH